MAEIKPAEEHALRVKQFATTTPFPHLYYDVGDDNQNASLVPPIEEWGKVLIGKKLVRANEERSENV